MRLILLLFICVGLYSQTFSQKLLALENTRKFRRTIFRVGDHISFRTHDSKAEFSGIIQSVDDSLLVIVKVIKMENEGDATNVRYEDSVPMREIKSVYYVKDSYWQFFRGIYGGGSVIGGTVLLGITGINYLTDNQRTPIDQKAVKITLGIMASGVLVWLIGSRKYRKLGNKWRLRAMEPFE